MPKTSAGLLLYRRTSGGIDVFLVHPGGPFWAKKDAGAWSIPKGEYVPGEDSLDAARREFAEETGIVPDGELVDLGVVKQAGGKVVTAWALEGDCDPDAIRSNTFAMEWPPKSGRQQEFPEVDRAGWFDLETAEEKISKGQLDLIRRLGEMLRT
ncbi:MAG TPA: NUDIX domain-containing protein [Longimicrobium sp.]|jgi:predicted NUDIX family NTP pyrophosphohydrolase|nr:NUDIX domain-containing protein [Longimicrobium sp.]